jgi:sRNA-binding regulator protein Hfq
MYKVKIVLKNGRELTSTAKSYDVYDDVIACNAEEERITVFKSEISYFIVTKIC